MKRIMENNKQKRILWLLNHSTLRNFEVGMLVRLGFEVFIPKVIPFDEANQSASVVFEYDETLTIKKDFLTQLNHFDFYARPWPRSLERKINQNFGIAFVPVFQKMVENTIHSFDGLLFLRVFGLAGENSYAELFKEFLSSAAMQKIRSDGSVRIAAGYDSLIDHEPPWLRRKCIHLPLGLSDLGFKNTHWRGDKKQLLFICPRINSSPYYNRIYKNFKRSFEHVPHIIPGAQPTRVKNDPAVTGFLEKEEYLEIFRSSKVMFYHSDEERHLHYHPLEAVKIGMPLVFMRGGMLEYLAKKKLPGCCNSIEEAQEKISRILNDDRELIEEIVSSQKVLLDEFNPKYVEECWRQRFLPAVEDHFQKINILQNEQPGKELTHIGIWMHAYDPRDLTGEGISRLIAMIVRGVQKQERGNVRLHIALVTWMKQVVIDFLDAEGVNTDQLDFEVAGSRPPFLYQFYYWWVNRKPRRKRKYPFWQRIENTLKDIFGFISDRFLTVRTILGLILALVVLVVLLPVLVATAVVYLVVRIIGSFINWLLHILGIIPLMSKLKEKINQVRTNVFERAPAVFQRMLRAELRQLTEKVGWDDTFKAWFFAYPNNRYIDQFSSIKIVAVPDVVYMDFPSLYSRYMTDSIDDLKKDLSRTIRNADAVVTFSDYVREEHVVKHNLQPVEYVHVIPHAPLDKRAAITIRKDIGGFDLHFMAKHIIRNYIAKSMDDSDDDLTLYLHDLDLGEIDYLFVSSQTRLHKNHLNLIKAYRMLLREKYVNQKLVITGKFTDEIRDYVNKERLHLDVLSFNKLPARVHAAFYACANLTVAPTLFEGGFPFVFSESLSVRTPVILSDIPVVREALTKKECEQYCFDPYDIRGMADKMEWALENHDALLKQQQKTLEKMKTRTWEDVAEEYLKLFLETRPRNSKEVDDRDSI